MKHTFFALLLVLTFSSCQKEKIGYVNNGDVINELQEKKDIEKKYQDKDSIFQIKRDSMIRVYQMELKEAQETAKNLSQQKLQELSMQFQQKEQVLSQKIQTEQQQIESAFQTEIDSLISKVKSHVKDYGAKNGYSYILGNSEAVASVLYGKPENDLTETILKELNDNYSKKE